MDFLQRCDAWLFGQINGHWHTPFLDSWLPLYRDANFWIPVYLFILVWAFLNFGVKIWPWVLFIVITLTLTDQLSSHVMKPLFGRLRPCQDPALAPWLRLVAGYCPGNASFTSSHAANHFGFSVFVFLTMREWLNRFGTILLFFWAASVSYAQVYVGIHYPGDVLGGALLGSLCAWLTSFLFLRLNGKPQPWQPAKSA